MDAMPHALRDLSSLLELSFQQDHECSDELMEHTAKILQKFGLKGVKQVIYELLDKPALLEKMAEISYFQGNGFYKIVLLNSHAFSLRFHIWFPDNPSQENLHSHQWYFASTILSGSLESEIWEDCALPESAIYDEYHYHDKHHDPVLMGKTKLKLLDIKRYNAGDCYYLNPTTLHRVMQNKNELVATLMCHASVSRDWSRSIPLGENPPRVIPQYMTSRDLVRVFNRYLEMDCRDEAMPRPCVTNLL